MTAVEVLCAFCLRGGAVYPTPDGALELEGPDAAVDEFLPLVREHKPALLEILAAPRKAAYRVWEGAMGEISAAWEAHEKEARAAGHEPVWFDDLSLTDAVRETIKGTVDGGALAAALRAIEAWRSEWLRLLAEENRPPCQGELPLGSGAAGAPEPAQESRREYLNRKREAERPKPRGERYL